MNKLKQNVRWVAAVIALLGLTRVASATLIVWSEDFSNVSDWSVISDPGGGSSITSDGNLGSFYVNASNNVAAFGPNHTGTSGLALFNTANKNDYFLNFTVDSLTWSTSYDLALDEFGADGQYTGTVWQVFPALSTSTDTGSFSVALGAFTYDPGIMYILPKLTVHTGDGGQTVRFDSMSITETVPEPSSVMLFVTGLGLVWRWYVRTRKRARL
jgi:hypothetical protein